jgi:hypothetical protein
MQLEVNIQMKLVKSVKFMIFLRINGQRLQIYNNQDTIIQLLYSKTDTYMLLVAEIVLLKIH